MHSKERVQGLVSERSLSEWKVKAALVNVQVFIMVEDTGDLASKVDKIHNRKQTQF